MYFHRTMLKISWTEKEIKRNGVNQLTQQHHPKIEYVKSQAKLFQPCLEKRETGISHDNRNRND